MQGYPQVAANTIETLLIRLGFDVSDLEKGVALTRTHFESLNSSASKMAATFVPASAALDRFVQAADRVQGSARAPQALRNMATAAADLSNRLQGTQAAVSTTISRFSMLSNSLASSTKSGTVLRDFSTGIREVTTATNGSIPSVTAWINQIKRLNSSDIVTSAKQMSNAIQETVRHTQLAASATQTYSSLLQQRGRIAVAAATLEQMAAKETADLNLQATAIILGRMHQEQQAQLAARAAAQATANHLISINMKMMMVNQEVARQKAAQLAAEKAQAKATYDHLIKIRMQQQIVERLAQKETQNNLIAQLALQKLVNEEMKRQNSIAMSKAVYAGKQAGYVQGQGYVVEAAAAKPKIDAVGNAIEGVTRKAGYMQRVLSMAFAFSGGVAVTAAIAFIGNAVLGFNSKIQQAQIAFTNFLGSADEADEFIRKMQDFANVTPFNFSGLTESVQKLIAMGFAADEALPVLRAIGDAVAGLGGSQDKLDRVAIALGQIKTAGRVTSQDMRQLTEAGIPAWEMLAQSIGKTQGETRKLAEAGLIPAGDALKALVTGMNDRYGGMMAKQARTAQGAFETLRDTIVQAIANAVKPAFDLLTAGMVTLADFMVNGGGKMIAPIIYAIGVALAVTLIPRLWGLVNSIAAVKVAFLGISTSLAPLLIIVTALGIAWQENFLGIRSGLEPALKSLAGVFKAVGDHASELTGVIQVLAAAIGIKLVVAYGLALKAKVLDSIATAINAITMDGAAVATNGLALAQVRAAFAAGGLRGALVAVGAVLGGVATAATMGLAAAVVLLATNYDQVTQGLRVVYYAFLKIEEAIANFLTSLPVVGQAFTFFKDHVASELSDLTNEMAKTQAAIDAANANKPDEGATSSATIFADIDKQLQDWLAKTGNAAGQMGDATADMVKTFGTSIQGIVNAAGSVGAESMRSMAEGIRSAQSAPLDAFKEMVTAMAAPMSTENEIARLLGMQQSSQLLEGLQSNDSGIRAWAEATQKSIIDRLNQITEGAYSAGQNAALAYQMAWEEVQDNYGPSESGSTDLVTRLKKRAQEIMDVWNKIKPSPKAVADAMKDVNKELQEMKVNTQALSDLSSAFSDIRSAANEFFSELHNAKLKAIDDELKHKNAILDTKSALNQSPVDAAQRALDARRKQIEEWRLREAIRTASSPEAYRDAVLALQDFLAQQKINEMQSEVDKANAVIDAKKQANEAKAEADRAAENRRYELMKRDFERQLQLLQDYLSKHPGEWQKVEGQIIGLLHGYGFSYDRAGQLLGDSFVQGLREKIAAAEEAARALANAGNPDNYRVVGGSWNDSGSSNGGGGGGAHPVPIPLASGMWDTMNRNVLAMLHPREMVAPETSASLLRALGEREIDFTPSAPSISARPTGGSGPRTIIFQVGDEKLGEITDKAMYNQAATYGGRGIVKVGGSSR